MTKFSDSFRRINPPPMWAKDMLLGKKTKTHIISRDNAIITDLEQLKTEARQRNDEATAKVLDGVIFRLLCLSK